MIKNNPRKQPKTELRKRETIDKISIAFVIRMHYEKGDPNWEWRLNYFSSMVLPKLLRQQTTHGTKKFNFDICIWANKWQEKQLKALSPKIKIFNVKKEKRGYVSPEWEEKAKRYFIDFMNFKDVVGLGMYDIQIAIDSDDLLITDTFVQKIYSECMDNKDVHTHLTFQPYVFDAQELKTYRSHIQYSAQRGSAFYAIYQPDKTDYLFAYHTTHQKMPSFAKKVIVVKEGYCAYTVHGRNDSSCIAGGMRQIAI